MTNPAYKLPDVCKECGEITYPPQGFCTHCLSEEIGTKPVPFAGKVLAQTMLHHSFEAAISSHLPVPVCSVEIQAGVVVFALSRDAKLQAGEHVLVDVEPWPFGKRLTVKRIDNDRKS